MTSFITWFTDIQDGDDNLKWWSILQDNDNMNGAFICVCVSCLETEIGVSSQVYNHIILPGRHSKVIVHTSLKKSLSHCASVKKVWLKFFVAEVSLRTF